MSTANLCAEKRATAVFPSVDVDALRCDMGRDDQRRAALRPAGKA